MEGGSLNFFLETPAGTRIVWTAVGIVITIVIMALYCGCRGKVSALKVMYRIPQTIEWNCVESEQVLSQRIVFQLCRPPPPSCPIPLPPGDHQRTYERIY